jgi:hypothetical protein
MYAYIVALAYFDPEAEDIYSYIGSFSVDLHNVVFLNISAE